MIKAANLLKSEIPTQTDIEIIPLFDLSSVVEDIRIKTRKASQNTDLDMQEFLGISKALQSINGELRNNTAKPSELDKRIKRDTAKLKEIEDDPEGFLRNRKSSIKNVYKTSKKSDKQGSNFYHKTVGIFQHK